MSTESRAAPRPRQYVAELQGLRGLALLLVVLFHLFGQGRVSGGVDVFLVVSAFLCTLTVVAHLDAGTLRVSRQLGRTLWRLAPAALTVLLAVAALTVVVLPATRWPAIANQIAASALGLENWELIRAGLSYGAVDAGANPLQHFWSLSVQLQFLLLWPVVLLGAHRLARRLHLPTRGTIATLVAVTTVASFAYAAYLSVVDQDVAYFSSLTRFWELGVGAGLALLYPVLRLPGRVGAALVVAGLALLVTCGFVLDGAVLFPGPWALWPVLAATLVILGATAESPAVRRALDNKPWHLVAVNSYALYLWHWPIMVFYLAWRTHMELGLRGAVVVLAVSCALAWATTRFVEAPSRAALPRFTPRRALTAGVAASLAVASIGIGTTLTIDRRVDDELVLAADRSVHPGAGGFALPAATSSTPAPDPAIAPFDRPTGEDCSQSHLEAPRYDEVVRCPVTVAPAEAPTVMLVGGSHVEQWIPTVEALAERHGWSVTALIKQGCRLSTAEAAPPDRPSCARWSENAMDVLRAERPDLVLVMGTWTAWAEPERAASDAQVQTWDELVAAGVDVVALRDTPRFEQSVPECLLAHDAATCTKDRSAVYGDWATLRAAETSAHQVDLSDQFCTDTECPPVIGNVVAYRDQDHMTATYARTLDDALEQELAPLGLSVFDDAEGRTASVGAASD